MEKITKPREYRKFSVSFQKRAKFQSKAYFNRSHQGDRQESYFFLKSAFIVILVLFTALWLVPVKFKSYCIVYNIYKLNWDRN